MFPFLSSVKNKQCEIIFIVDINHFSIFFRLFPEKAFIVILVEPRSGLVEENLLGLLLDWFQELCKFHLVKVM